MRLPIINELLSLDGAVYDYWINMALIIDDNNDKLDYVTNNNAMSHCITIKLYQCIHIT